MKTKYRASFSLVIVIALLVFSPVSWAATTPITLEEALRLALAQNASHALFLWEQDLFEQKEALKKHPQVVLRTDPVSVADGHIQGPKGTLTMSMPLGDNLDLSGKVTLGMHDKGVQVTPSGSLDLDYQFFSVSETSSGGPSPEENRQKQVNNLVLQTVDTLIELRQKLDLQSYEEARLGYLETMLEAARQTPDYDDLELRKEIRDQHATLALGAEKIETLQLRLATILGTSGITYDPVFVVQELNIQLDEEVLQEDMFASSIALREARTALETAQEKLALERRSRGWDVNANGAISLNPSSESTGQDPWGWSIGLSATKTLYPRNVILEELELAVAKGEHALENVETSLMTELRGAVQGVRAAQDRKKLKADHLGEVREDLALRHRQYDAGLVTLLQVEDTALDLNRAELDYAHESMSLAQSILNLWNVCGRDVRTLVFQVIQ